MKIKKGIMKHSLIFIIIMVVTLTGCNGLDGNFHEKKENYTAILYSNSGNIIKQYTISSYLTRDDGSCLITYPEGKMIKISGTYEIIEN